MGKLPVDTLFQCTHLKKFKQYSPENVPRKSWELFFSFNFKKIGTKFCTYRKVFSVVVVTYI